MAAERTPTARGRRLFRRVLGRLSPVPRRLTLLSGRSVVEFFDDDGPQLAAAISFHVLLSIFPLLILLLALTGALADQHTVRANVINVVSTYLPLSDHGRQSLAQLLSQMQNGSSALGVLGLVGVLVAASGMMTSTRRALTRAWDTGTTRGLVRGKLFDLALVVVAAVVLGLSFGLTLAVRMARSGSHAAAQALGPLGPLAEAAGWLVGFAVPLLLAFGLFAFFYTVVPTTGSRLTTTWPGALVGALGFQLLKEGFAVYLAHFAHYQAVYGSLGAAAAFIFFVYLSANAFILGAEVASEYPRLP